MSSTYIYSLSLDFNDGVDIDLLQKEVNDSSIVPNLSYILILGDDVSFVFENSLDSSEESILDTIIDAHSPPKPNPNVDDVKFSIPFTIIVSRIANQKGAIRFAILNLPSNKLGKPKSISITSYSGSLNKNYQIKLFNSSKRIVLAEKNFNYAQETTDYIDISSVNFDNSSNMLELQVTPETIDQTIFIFEATLFLT